MVISWIRAWGFGFRRRSRLSGSRRHRQPPLRFDLQALEPRVLLSGVGSAVEGIAVYVDAALTEPGLTGTYVNRSLRDEPAMDDWRLSQPVAGTRVDSLIEFTSNGWGSRASVGLTYGDDNDWENYSVQWDGYLQVLAAGQRLATVSDDGSRLWIDLDLSGGFESTELIDNGWGQGHDARIGDRTAALAAGVYPIRIQFEEGQGDNTFQLVGSPYVPRQFTPTATNPLQVIRVIALNFDPRVPTEGNRLLHEVMSWSDPRMLASRFERDLEWATGGAIDIQVVEWRDLDAFPVFTDGFRYSPDEYVSIRRDGTGFHDTTTDFYHLIDSQGLGPLINAGLVDEVWTFGDHYFNLLGEAWMAGPNSFFINGPSFPDAGFDRAVAGYGFNYERGVAEMIHNLGHRIENHGQRAFGAWNLAEPVTAWDRYSSNYLESNEGPYGVGTAHVPANADGHYDYADPRVVSSIADQFVDYPNAPGPASDVTMTTWTMGPVPDDQRDYLNWYLAMMPRNDGTAADGRAANWYKYIWDFNSYEAETGLARHEEAFAAGPIVRRAGGTSYDLTVRYYDQTAIDPTTLDDQDIRVIGPSGQPLTASLVDPGVSAATTAGTARTVTYRITPPGGSWDVADSGVYRVMGQPDQVQDTLGNFVAAGDIGFFRVAVSDPRMLNLNAMIQSGSLSVEHTPFDIGSAAEVFDGDAATLARTPGIDPLVMTLTFDAEQSVAAFETVFSHADGDPAFSYSLESANSKADMETKTGSYQLLSFDTPAHADVISQVAFSSPVAAKLFRLTATRLTGDDYIHINEWRLLGVERMDQTAPEAALLSVPKPQPAQSAQFVTVQFTDDLAVEVRSIDTGDLRITGPGGVSITPTFYDVDQHYNGPQHTATYWFEPPGGDWDDSDNGTYVVRLRSGQVRDAQFNTSMQDVVLGEFQVTIPPAQRVPPLDLAEGNASDWGASAEGGSAGTSNDTTRRLAGQSSVRFDTNGGFDTSLSYPVNFGADWDLSTADNLRFSLFAQNPSPFGFQEGPWVRLYGTDGGYFEYRYYQNDQPAAPINSALNEWADFAIPLNPAASSTGWRRTVSGPVSLEHVAAAEFHADTWDFGFSLWVDDVRFDVALPYDVNADGRYDGADVDALSHYLRGGLPPAGPIDFTGGSVAVGFDHMPNGVSDANDRDYFVTEVLATRYGDANVDREVNITDLSTVATFFGGAGSWSSGDFTGDGLVTISDLSLLATYFGFQAADASPLLLEAKPAKATASLDESRRAVLVTSMIARLNNAPREIGGLWRWIDDVLAANRPQRDKSDFGK